MASFTSFLFCYLITCIFLSLATADDGRKAYIVYMGSLPSGVDYSPSSHHLNVLQSVLDGSISPENSIIKSYTHSFNGFAARLTEAEKERLVRLKGIVSVFPDRILKLQTTRSWDFSGLPLNVERRKAIESDIIIGVLDTGIWPESESFKDDGFGPIPKKWKGDCPKSFPCNKKLIGAKDLTAKVGGSPRDSLGHGTHTASTAAGSIVDGASFFGVANGSARGAVPSSRIAAYKVCSEIGCTDSDILAGFDNAIKDGVDIITVSLGSDDVVPFATDSTAVGAFHAFDKGILTVQSAGNNGFGLGTTTSVAPWLFSVAASTIDRRIASKTILGNGKTLIGNSINSDKLKDGYSLVYGKDATSNPTCSPEDAGYCMDSCLDSKLVQGKIVVCHGPYGVEGAKTAGAVASIIPSEQKDISSIHSLPTSALETKDFEEVLTYYNHSKSAKASIAPTESLFDSAAPTVADFSSRGPNGILTDILKPDITAPGVTILAAYSPKARLTDDDNRSVNFSILTGTSMSCPHVTGASAYVKSFRPTWSPSAIKSALITTAWPLDSKKNPDAEFAYGAGHIDPVRALNPGLVYETNTDDYISFFCKLGYKASTIELIVGRKVAECSKGSEKTSPPVDVNYPTFAAKVNLTKPFTVVFQRTVTNVGDTNSTYKANVSSSPRIRVSVEPSSLSFRSLNEKLSFNVTVTGSGGGKVNVGSKETASLEWFDGYHRVRSPIVVYQIDTSSVGRRVAW